MSYEYIKRLYSKSYTINEKQLKSQKDKIKTLQTTISLLIGSFKYALD